MQRTHLCNVSLLQNYCPRRITVILLQKAVCDSLIVSVPLSPLPALHLTLRRILQTPTQINLDLRQPVKTLALILD